MQGLLDDHIERELPKVRSEIKSLLADTEAELADLGDDRPTVSHMRMYLTRRSMDFHSLVQSALDGNYHERDSDFFREDYTMRLRAVVHQLNASFADEMRVNGRKRKLCESTSLAPLTDSPNEASESESDSKTGPLLVTKKELNSWIQKTYLHTRGRELPGNYNHVLLAELFHEQSSRWEDIAEEHVTKLFNVTADFIECVTARVIHEKDMQREILLLANNKLDEGKKSANDELLKLVADEKRQPITYNHYYTDNIQKARDSAMKASIQKAVRGAAEQDWNGKFHIENTPLHLEKLLVSLEKRVIVNMDDQACAEALGALEAYYKVAMKTFVDNVCRQVIERHILGQLADIFAPTTVMSLSEEDLIRIASEPARQRERRLQLMLLAQGLRESLLDLRS